MPKTEALRQRVIEFLPDEERQILLTAILSAIAQYESSPVGRAYPRLLNLLHRLSGTDTMVAVHRSYPSTVETQTMAEVYLRHPANPTIYEFDPGARESQEGEVHCTHFSDGSLLFTNPHTAELIVKHSPKE